MKFTPVYKTAAELGIEQWEHDGLVALIGPLSRGELILDMKTAGKKRWKRKFLFFQQDCGTARCIGGHLASRYGMPAVFYVNSRIGAHPLGRLYFPTCCPKRVQHPAWYCNDKQAARAIVNFLILGDSCWDDVMREGNGG